MRREANLHYVCLKTLMFAIVLTACAFDPDSSQGEEYSSWRTEKNRSEIESSEVLRDSKTFDQGEAKRIGEEKVEKLSDEVISCGTEALVSDVARFEWEALPGKVSVSELDANQIHLVGNSTRHLTAEFQAFLRGAGKPRSFKLPSVTLSPDKSKVVGVDLSKSTVEFQDLMAPATLEISIRLFDETGQFVQAVSVPTLYLHGKSGEETSLMAYQKGALKDHANSGDLKSKFTALTQKPGFVAVVDGGAGNVDPSEIRKDEP